MTEQQLVDALQSYVGETLVGVEARPTLNFAACLTLRFADGRDVTLLAVGPSGAYVQLEVLP